MNRHAPTIHERLLHIERGRASDELDQLETILAMMHYNVGSQLWWTLWTSCVLTQAFYSINLNARAIALQHRNREVYTMLDIMAAGGQSHTSRCHSHS